MKTLGGMVPMEAGESHHRSGILESRPHLAHEGTRRTTNCSERLRPISTCMHYSSLGTLPQDVLDEQHPGSMSSMLFLYLKQSQA